LPNLSFPGIQPVSAHLSIKMNLSVSSKLIKAISKTINTLGNRSNEFEWKRELILDKRSVEGYVFTDLA
jgi:hypothetical protein